MDPEVKREFAELHALVKDNHRLLRAVRRHQILEMFGKLALWLIIILVSGYAYIAYLNPLVAQFFSGASSTPFGIPSSADLQKLIDSYKEPG